VGYLSDEAAERVCQLENVLYCEKSETFEIPKKVNKNPKGDNDNDNDNDNGNDGNNNIKNKKLDDYYDINVIHKKN